MVYRISVLDYIRVFFYKLFRNSRNAHRVIACFPPAGKHHIIMISFPPQFKFQRNLCADLRFYTQRLQRQIRGGDLIRFLRCSSVGRHTEGQFLLHTVRIIDLNGMAGSVACIANDTPVACLVHKIAVYKLPVLFLRHIPQSAIRLATFLHLQRELDGERHIERQGSDRGK